MYKLYTKHGFVAEVETSVPYHTPPDILVWGSRVFSLDKYDVYYESFAAVCVEIKSPEDKETVN